MSAELEYDGESTTSINCQDDRLLDLSRRFWTFFSTAAGRSGSNSSTRWVSVLDLFRTGSSPSMVCYKAQTDARYLVLKFLPLRRHPLFIIRAPRWSKEWRHAQKIEEEDRRKTIYYYLCYYYYYLMLCCVGLPSWRVERSTTSRVGIRVIELSMTNTN